jgi:hypothetical protein
MGNKKQENRTNKQQLIKQTKKNKPFEIEFNNDNKAFSSKECKFGLFSSCKTNIGLERADKRFGSKKCKIPHFETHCFIDFANSDGE